MSNPKEYEALVFLSGGIDSTYVVWDFLRKNPDKKLLIYHCHMKNFENRLEYESRATMSIIQWLKDNKLTNFDFIESGFDYGTLPTIVQDIELWGLFMSIIKRAYSVKYSKTFICASKYDIGLPGYETKSKRRYDLIKALCPLHDMNYTYPIIDKTRQELIDELPMDLLKLTWYCRRPTEEGKRCRECKTCKETIPYINIKRN